MKKLLCILLSIVMMILLAVPAFASSDYSDVDDGAWYSAAVGYMRENNLMNGTGDGKFSPNATLDRATMVTVLYRFAGEPETKDSTGFSDVPAGKWYSKAIAWAKESGIVTGYGSAFGPTDRLTREQMAAILWRYAGEPETVSSEEFADAGDISGWAKEAVAWARANKVISGVGDNRFDPNGSANRAQLAQVLMNGIESQVLTKPEPMPSPEPSENPDAVTGASQQTPALSPTAAPTAEPTPTPAPVTEKILIAYFSRAGENYSVGVVDEGNTAKFAKEIEVRLKASGKDVTLFEIVPSDPYPSGYEDTKTRATQEKNSDARPGIVGTVSDFDEYDTVFIGYPIWWGDLPMILHTFMERYDFSGKTVIPFNTHEGSGQSGTQSAIASKLSGATVKQGLAIRGSTAQNFTTYGQNAEVKNWLQSLGY